MKTVYRKLRSESGITLLYGIIAALIASFASAVIVSAASSAYRRVSDDRQTQQDHLTLLSAAKLVQEELEDTKLYIVTTETTASENTEKYYLFASDQISSPVMTKAAPEIENSLTYYESEKAFSKELASALRFILTYGDDFSSSFTVSAVPEDDDDSEQNFETVQVNMTVKSSEAEFGWLYLTFSLEGCDETLYLKTIPLGIMKKENTAGEDDDIMNCLSAGGRILKSGEDFTGLVSAFSAVTGIPDSAAEDEENTQIRYISSVEICEWGESDISEVSR